MFFARSACCPFPTALLLFSLGLLGCSGNPTETSTSTPPSLAGDSSAPALSAVEHAAQQPLATNQFSPLRQAEGIADATTPTRFSLLDPAETGVDFTNRLDLQHSLKRLYLSGFICGGIAVGDVDGDGNPDLFLASGPGRNGLYRQTGNFIFEDITKTAGVDGGDRWGAGAAMVDIDNDGDLDIYVCNYDSPNQLFINDGTGRFREAAKDFGLDLVDACLMPAFCDYDCDGDLDVYVLTNRYYRAGGRPNKPPFSMRDGKPYVLREFEKYYCLKHKGGSKFDMDTVGRSDYLFRNNGDGTFTETSSDAGIVQPGHGLSITWWDCNHDGLPDALRQTLSK